MDADRLEMPLQELNHCDSFLDWRGRPCKRSRHGGMRAAGCVFGFLALETMASVAVGNNLITYVFNEMHFSLSSSANTVTNFVGTTFLLSLMGGFIADSYLGSFWTVTIFGSLEFLGYLLLSIQAHVPQLKPPPCDMAHEGNDCLEPNRFQAFTFYLALYLLAFAAGCLKPAIACHGANQFSKQDPNQSKKQSIYFNAGYFMGQIAQVIALTVVVWFQTSRGMDFGFALSSAIMMIGLISFASGTCFYRINPPSGNIFTPMAQVVVAAVMKRKQPHVSATLLHGNRTDSHQGTNSSVDLLHTNKFRFLDKACIRVEDGDHTENGWRLCTVAQSEEVKVIISTLPIFACTVIFYTIAAQLQTLTVQQGKVMDRRLTDNFKIPPASFQCIPCLMLIVLVPLYGGVFVPFARKITRKESGISTLQRMGIGLLVVPFSMVAAALVEQKRRNAAIKLHETLSIAWIVPQFLVFGFAEMFTVVGLIEFFYKQSLGRIQAFLIAVSYCAYSFGFYLSTLFLNVVNNITSSVSGEGWLSYDDLNKDKLDYFYWLLAALSILNFLNYLYWSNWYSYNPSLSPTPPQSSSVNGEAP